jgi:hypothetical protein
MNDGRRRDTVGEPREECNRSLVLVCFNRGQMDSLSSAKPFTSHCVSPGIRALYFCKAGVYMCIAYVRKLCFGHDFKLGSFLNFETEPRRLKTRDMSLRTDSAGQSQRTVAHYRVHETSNQIS